MKLSGLGRRSAARFDMAALSLCFGERISQGDLRAVLFWSGLASVVAIGGGYAPAMFALRRWLAQRAQTAFWAYPAVGIALDVVPVLIILGVWSSNLGRALLSPEAFLFYCMFAVFGGVFGLGFHLAYGRAA